MGTSVDRHSNNTSYYTMGNMIPGMKMDGNNVLAVREGMKMVKDYCGNGNGPMYATLNFVGTIFLYMRIIFLFVFPYSRIHLLFGKYHLLVFPYSNMRIMLLLLFSFLEQHHLSLSRHSYQDLLNHL